MTGLPSLFDLARLRRQIETHPVSWPQAELRSLVEVLELAANLMYAPTEDGRDHETPLLNALARFDFVDRTAE